MSRDIRTREELDSIFTQRENNNDIYLVGAGYYGKTVGAYLNTQKRVWSGYVDKKKKGQEIAGKMVVDYSYPFDSSSIFICTAGGQLHHTWSGSLKTCKLRKKEYIQ